MVTFFQLLTTVFSFSKIQFVRLDRLGLELLLEVLLMFAPANLDRMAQIGEYLRDVGDLQASLPSLIVFAAWWGYVVLSIMSAMNKDAG